MKSKIFDSVGARMSILLSAVVRHNVTPGHIILHSASIMWPRVALNAEWVIRSQCILGAWKHLVVVRRSVLSSNNRRLGCYWEPVWNTVSVCPLFFYELMARLPTRTWGVGLSNPANIPFIGNKWEERRELWRVAPTGQGRSEGYK